MKKILAFGVFVLFLSVTFVLAGETFILKVKIQDANVRSEPDPNASVVKTLPLGTLLESDNKIGVWYEIIVLDEKGAKVSAYIHSSVVDIVSGGVAQPVQTPVQASQQPAPAPAYQKPRGLVSIGLQMIYFLPSDADFKSIYGRGWKYGGEITFNLTKGLGLWLDGGYYAKTGGLSYSKEETKLTLIPIGAGLRYRFLTGTFEPYVGAGVRYNIYQESNVIGDVSGGGIGFVGKAGLVLYPVKGFGIDVHVAYSSCKMKPADYEFDVGGIELGAGIVF